MVVAGVEKGLYWVKLPIKDKNYNEISNWCKNHNVMIIRWHRTDELFYSSDLYDFYKIYFNNKHDHMLFCLMFPFDRFDWKYIK